MKGTKTRAALRAVLDVIERAPAHEYAERDGKRYVTVRLPLGHFEWLQAVKERQDRRARRAAR